MKKISLLLAFAAFAHLSISPAGAQTLQCPAGTHPWNDGWGNPTCRAFFSNHDVITGVNPVTGIPNGAVPSVDSWGNQTSRGFGPTAGQTYYNTSQGCPVGTQPWNDQWGNPTCKPF